MPRAPHGPGLTPRSIGRIITPASGTATDELLDCFPKEARSSRSERGRVTWNPGSLGLTVEQGRSSISRKRLDAYAAHYAAAGLKAHAIDLTTRPTLASVVGTNFDLALSLEVVEHLPIPPSEHLAPIVEVLRPGGALLLSTPNAGNLRSALKTLLHRPTLPPAEQAFAVVGHENEGVHRREYMRSEIVEAFERCGLTVTGTGWVSYGRHDGADTIFLPIEWLIPRWRLTMAITGVTKSA